MLILSKNHFNIEQKKRLIDFYVPLTIKLSDEKYLYNHSYFRFISANNLVEIDIDQESGKLIKLTVVKSDNINLYNKKFDLDHFINFQMSLYFLPAMKDMKNILTYLEVNQEINLDIFDNAVVIYLNKEKSPLFLFYENEVLGILTDRFFNVVAFISWDLSENEKKELLEYAQSRKIENLYKDFTNYERDTIQMISNIKIIQHIFNLKEVNFWKLLTYGLSMKIIDNAFVVEFAEECLNQKIETNKQLTLTISSLLKNEYNKVGELLKTKSDISIEEMKIYNQIWFYLNSVNDLIKLGLLK